MRYLPIILSIAVFMGVFVSALVFVSPFHVASGAYITGFVLDIFKFYLAFIAGLGVLIISLCLTDQ